MTFTVDDVRKIVTEKSQTNRETYRELFGLCERKIKHTISFDKKAKNVTFVLPPFIIGKPVYNRDHAVRYIVEKLARGGFRASAKDENRSIFIDWKKKKN